VRLPAVVLTVVCGCNNLLGLTAPVEQRDAAPSVDAAADAAPVGDFALTVTGAVRVPAGSFDFYDIAIARSGGFDAAVTVSIASPPTGVTSVPITIAADQTTAQLQVSGSTALTIGSALQLDVVAQGGGRSHDQAVTVVVTGVPGTVDVGFGSGGVAVLDNDPYAFGLVLADDRIVAVGDGSNGHNTVVRLTAQGAGDTTFGIDGVFVSQPVKSTLAGPIAVAPDGDYITALGIFVQAGQFQIPQGAMTAVLASGAGNDPAFGTAGTLSLSQFAEITSVAVQPDGRILAATFGGDSIIRLLGNGSADPSWPDPGLAFSPVQLALTGSGSILVALQGQGSGGGSDTQVDMLQLTSAGTPDLGYGSAGTAIVDYGATSLAEPDAFAVLGDGSTVVVGDLVVGSDLQQMFVLKLTPAGVPDPTFGSGGTAVIPTVGSTAGHAIAVQADGRIDVVGETSSPEGPVVARLLADGSFDPTFGTAGVAFIEDVGFDVFISAIGIQSNGEIVLIGSSSNDLQGLVTRIWF
jgi:uncharacterized delta-60 repeat protein